MNNFLVSASKNGCFIKWNILDFKSTSEKCHDAYQVYQCGLLKKFKREQWLFIGTKKTGNILGFSGNEMNFSNDNARYFYGHKDTITSLAIVKDAITLDYLVSASLDGTIRKWSLFPKELVKVIFSSKEPIQTLYCFGTDIFFKLKNKQVNVIGTMKQEFSKASAIALSSSAFKFDSPLETFHLALLNEKKINILSYNYFEKISVIVNKATSDFPMYIRDMGNGLLFVCNHNDDQFKKNCSIITLKRNYNKTLYFETLYTRTNKLKVEAITTLSNLYFAIGSSDGTIIIWDKKMNEKTYHVPILFNSNITVFLSLNKHDLLMCNEYSCIVEDIKKMQNYSRGIHIKIFDKGTERIESAILVDKKNILIRASNHKIIILNALDFKITNSLILNIKTEFLFSESEGIIKYFGSMENEYFCVNKVFYDYESYNSIKIYKFFDNNVSEYHEIFTSFVIKIIVLNDNNLAIARNEEYKSTTIHVYIWCFNSKSIIQILTPRYYSENIILYKNSMLLSFPRSGNIEIWNSFINKPNIPRRQSKKSLDSYLLIKDNNTINRALIETSSNLVTSLNDAIKFYKISSQGLNMYQEIKTNSSATCFIFLNNSQSKFFLSGHLNGSISIWSFNENHSNFTFFKVLDSHFQSVINLAKHESSSKYFVSSSPLDELFVWDSETFELVNKLSGMKCNFKSRLLDKIQSIIFLYENILLSSTLYGDMYLWNLTDGHLIKNFNDEEYKNLGFNLEYRFFKIKKSLIGNRLYQSFEEGINIWSFNNKLDFEKNSIYIGYLVTYISIYNELIIGLLEDHTLFVFNENTKNYKKIQKLEFQSSLFIIDNSFYFENNQYVFKIITNDSLLNIYANENI